MTLYLDETMLVTGPLVIKAIARLEEKVESNPLDIKSLMLLGDLLRQTGNLDAALVCYQKLAKAQPENVYAQYVVSLLKQEPLPENPDLTRRPTPFVRINNFLTPTEINSIWSVLERHERSLSLAAIERGVDPEYRSANTLEANKLLSFSPGFLEKVCNSLDQHWANLACEPTKISDMEIELTSHSNGEFFKLHRDDGEDGLTAKRFITYVYYFYREPKGFEGGDLLLLDSSKEQHTVKSYTRLEPINNSLLFFPSIAYHQVSPVSSSGNNLDNCRLTLNGWLHKK